MAGSEWATDTCLLVDSSTPNACGGGVACGDLAMSCAAVKFVLTRQKCGCRKRVTGTEWAVVTTDNGKKYYYNGKLQVSH